MTQPSFQCEYQCPKDRSKCRCKTRLERSAWSQKLFVPRYCSKHRCTAPIETWGGFGDMRCPNVSFRHKYCVGHLNLYPTRRTIVLQSIMMRYIEKTKQFEEESRKRQQDKTKKIYYF